MEKLNKIQSVPSGFFDEKEQEPDLDALYNAFREEVPAQEPIVREKMDYAEALLEGDESEIRQHVELAIRVDTLIDQSKLKKRVKAKEKIGMEESDSDISEELDWRSKKI